MFPLPEQVSAYERCGQQFEQVLKKELGLLKRKLPSNLGIFRHQIEAAVKTTEFLKNRVASPALIIAPTGSGKTGILSLIPYLLRSKKTLVLTPSPAISHQIKAAVGLPNNPLNFFQKTSCFQDWTDGQINAFLPRAHVVQVSDDIGKVLDDLVIVNAQKFGGNSRTSLGRKNMDPDIIAKIETFFQNFDLLIVDEAHHFPATTWVKVCEAFKNRNPEGHLVFITATAERMIEGKKQRFLPIENDAYVITQEQLNGDILRPWDRSLFKFYPARSLEEHQKDLIEQVFKTLDEHDQIESRFSHQALIAVGKSAEALEIASLFNNVRPESTRAIIGGMHLRKDDVDDFRKGKFPVAVVCKMLVEGFDNPSISVCAVFKKVGSRPWLEQFLGRCLRKYRPLEGSPDKTRALLLTYAHFEIEPHCDALQDKAVADVGDMEEDDEERYIDKLLAKLSRSQVGM